ncbi:methylenetetrahydrofolate reductase [Chitinophaga rhizophila]|uniref:5,10-methylenetetrahydrofolate reductase n=1 Tax=Chitinophaga rhizophila TaxID=2866212 RepID=A0ABS7GBU8_9BACT|nr:5,10-methylenetetrahydrofolate reductase [Chitinophaga rhizophila]MBW8685143.1 5,10-methylenetetrahydrofolate reductase [Chitinophaga rhizophila]
MGHNLAEKIKSGGSRLVFYSLTPPKITNGQEKIAEIAKVQIARLSDHDIDGLILYDIQDESTRTGQERTFAFIPTLSPEQYSRTYLQSLDVPLIIYKSIANMNGEQFNQWLTENKDIKHAVFVGASSQQQIELTNFSLQDAYTLRQQVAPDLLLGGITIPERHNKKGDEHLRITGKVGQGCSFFVSQCVYNINDTKDLLADYYYHSNSTGMTPSPVIFTLAPCGSLKTLEFMEWLGIKVPKWLYNDLKHSKDILQSSIQTCLNVASELLEYADKKNMSIGFNIESVSIKKDEIAASVELLSEVIKLGKQPVKTVVQRQPTAIPEVI